MHPNRLVLYVPAMIGLLGLSLFAIGSARAMPKPAPEYWSVARCERVLPEEHPKMRQVLCVSIGGPSTCQWTRNHRVRLSSTLRVFAWYRQANFSTLGMLALEPGVVRSFTLATRARPGFTRIVHNYGDQYAGWPADYYAAHARLVGTHVPVERFHGVVTPLVAKLAEHAQSMDCTAA